MVVMQVYKVLNFNSRVIIRKQVNNRKWQIQWSMRTNVDWWISSHRYHYDTYLDHMLHRSLDIPFRRFFYKHPTTIFHLRQMFAASQFSFHKLHHQHPSTKHHRYNLDSYNESDILEILNHSALNHTFHKLRGNRRVQFYNMPFLRLGNHPLGFEANLFALRR